MEIFIQAAEQFLTLWQPTPPPPGKEGLANMPLIPLIPIIAAVVVLLVIIALVGVLLRRRQPGKAQRPGSVISAARPTRILAYEEISGWLILPDGRTAAINHLPFNLGGDSTNQAVVAAPTVAPQHARIFQDEMENALCIEDCSGGSNVLLVNGKPTRKNVLKNNDEITLGSVMVRFQLLQPASPAPVPMTTMDPRG